jgi:hypothetical protein
MLFAVCYARSNKCDRSRGRAPQTSRVAAVGPLFVAKSSQQSWQSSRRGSSNCSGDQLANNSVKKQAKTAAAGAS